MSIREKDTFINSMKITEIPSIRYDSYKLENYTCVNSNGVHAMFGIPYNF